MASSAPKEQWRALRRYVLAGDAQTAHNLLRMMTQEYPEDAEAAAELERMEKGLPLRATETAKERKERLTDEALLALARDIARYDAKTLACTHTHGLKELHSSLRAHLRLISDSGMPAPTGTNAYKKDLERELARRRKKSLKMRLAALGGLVLTLTALSGTVWALHRRAESYAQELRNAWHAEDWERSEALIKLTDTGINKLVHPEVQELLYMVRQWRESIYAKTKTLHLQMDIYKKRKAVSTLSLEERAAFLRRIRALPSVFSKELMERWDELCRPEKEKLDQQRDDILREVETADVAPTLTGAAADDASELRKTKSHLRRIIDTYENARETFDLPERHIAPLRELLEQVEVCLSDVEQLLHAEMSQRNALSYEQYCKATRGLAPKIYAPAVKAADAAQNLPTEESICNEVRAYRFKTPLVIPPEVIRAIVDKAPSFCPSYPASPQQVALMEDIFTSRLLRQKVYEIIHTSGQVHYADEYPSITSNNSVVFTLSELDPQRSVGKSPRVVWENAQGVWTRLLDATPILKATGIARETFFLTGNLPDILGRITHIHDKNCPALAKAYVYHTLLEVMRLHNKKPDILGLRYSPTLLQDIKSFRDVGSRCKTPLTIGCWLSRSGDTLAAEAQYAEWFDTHANRDYSAEMSKQLANILRKRPHYIGYVDAQGEARYKEPPRNGAPLWVISGGKLTTVPGGKPLPSPDPYSPIFAE